ncbi:hypothetical protein Y1Q_0023063 [Alligator mississippiensis]|uniref:Uncharacterized protein n=1 Tax=Alligator mississippiensis TaxID=8496 RepID=A0A151MM77_ALLMI|nr:hypothetical protein Y1Q_0023063 [Alligator mississippiensis]
MRVLWEEGFECPAGALGDSLGTCLPSGVLGRTGAEWSQAASRLPHVFYEQYLGIVDKGLFTLALCLAPTFAVNCLLLGLELHLGLANLVAVLSVLVGTSSAMTLWGIP